MEININSKTIDGLMGVRIESNLKHFQDAHVGQRIDLVAKALSTLAREKLPFSNLTKLAIRVADMVTAAENLIYLMETTNGSKSELKKKPVRVAHQTFIRTRDDGTANPYKLLLLQYMGGSFCEQSPCSNLTTKEVKAYVKKSPALESYFALKELENSNLKRRLEIKDIELERLQKFSISSPRSPAPVDTEISHTSDVEYQKAKDDLTKVVTLLHRILEQCDFFTVDDDKEMIYDGTTIYNLPLADKDLLAPFFRARKMMGVR